MKRREKEWVVGWRVGNAMQTPALMWPPPPCHPPGGGAPCSLPVTGTHHTMTVPASHPGFPGGSASTESSCSVGDLGLIPGSGRFPEGGHGNPVQYSWASLVAQLVKTSSAMWETWVRSLGREDPLEKGVAAHSRILAWRMSHPGKPGGPDRHFPSTGETDSWRAQTKPCAHQDSGERSSDATRD